MSRAQTRPAVSVAELQRAWAAVQTGAFRPAAPPLASRPAAGPRAVEVVDSDGATTGSGGAGTSPGWVPGPGEQALAVVGALGSCGASTLAVALATADGRAARVVECASATASGLAAAATAELGEQAGWLRGRRDRIVLERSAHVLTGPAALALPLPAAPETVRTVVDVSWEIGQLLGGGARSWLGEYLISGAASVVVATVATVPGIRRLEVVVDLLGADRVVAAVLGLPAKRWETSLASRAAPALRALGEASRVVRVPPCRRLARTGLDTSPLSPELLRAAGDLLDLADASGRTLITQGGRR